MQNFVLFTFFFFYSHFESGQGTGPDFSSLFGLYTVVLITGHLTFMAKSLVLLVKCLQKYWYETAWLVFNAYTTVHKQTLYFFL